MKQLWVLAGGNGAGKTTFFQLTLAESGLPFVNADEIARAEGLDPYRAAEVATRQRDRYLDEGLSFCYETVFSHPSKIDFLARALSLGYEIHLVIIHLASPDLNEARVHQRTGSGGHDVPTDKLRARIPRTLDNLRTAVPLCSTVLVLDNSDDRDPFRPVLRLAAGAVHTEAPDLPGWARTLLG